jgi:antitoxin ParD1/3/4
MAMTSLNISLPEPLKHYVEGQVASGDWGTPSEYSLEQDLIAAAKGPTIELAVTEIRKKGLVAALRSQTGRR